MKMKTKTKAKIAVSVVALICVVISDNIFADSGGWEGSGSDSGAGTTSTRNNGKTGSWNASCDTAERENNIDCAGVSWLKYEYKGGNSLSGTAINFVPGAGTYTEVGNGVGTGVGSISGECAKEGVGFYHLGINMKMGLGQYMPATKYNGWTYTFVGIPSGLSAKGATEPGYRGNVNALNVSVRYSGTNNDYAGADMLYPGSDYTYQYDFIYQSSVSGAWGHRGSFSVEKARYFAAANYYDMSYSGGTYQGGKGGRAKDFDHRIYYKSGGKYSLIYQSEGSASNEGTIKTAYEKYLNYMYPSGNQSVDDQKDYCSYNGSAWTCSDVPTNIYAFCAFGDAGNRKVQNRSILEYGNQQSVSGYNASTDFSKSDSFKDAESGKTKYTGGVITVQGSSVQVTGKFNIKTEDGKTFKSQAISYTTTTGSNKESGTVSFSGTTTISANNNGPVTVNLLPDTETTVCAEISSDQTIQSEGSSAANSGSTTSKACMKFKADPIVSKIQSKTKIAAAGKSAESDWDAYAVLDLGTAKPNADEYNKGVAYGSNKFDVVWTHTLKVAGQQYYSKLKSGSGYGGIIDNSQVKFHARPADNTGSLAGLDKQIQSVTPNSTKTINSWDSSIFKNSSLPSRYINGKISETGNIFPGQKLDGVSEFVFHDSEVYGDLKSYNGSFNDRESHATLTGVANYAECKLTGPEGKDVTYYMGVEGAANDYAGLYLDSSKGRTIVGDGADKATDVVWLNGGNNTKARLNYEACFGAQIAEDAAGGSGTDSFLLNTSDETLSNLPYDSKDPYYKGVTGPISEIVYTGRTPAKKVENKNILASEIGGGTVKDRLDRGYVVSASTGQFEQSILLGQSNLSYIAKTNGVSSTPSDTYAITMNVPYNYILDPQPATGSMGQDLSTITVGTPINFKAKIAVSPRKNKDVQDSEYNTSTKTTTIKANVFTVGPDESIADITGEPGATYKVFNVHGKGQDASIADLVGHNTVPNVEDAVENKAISASGTTIDTPKDKVFAESIGQKYCMAVAVYPADSHNTETTDIEKNADQSAALSGDTAGDGAYWRVSISCRTVAKYPSLSVEGNALHVAGSVNVSTPREITNGAVSGVFGSWSEYGIIAGSSPAMASGATLAYATAHTGLNTTGQAGGNSGMARYNIETVGDYDMSGAAGQTEVAAIRHEIATLRSRLSRFKEGGTDGVAIYGSDLFDTSAVTYSGGNLSINGDIIKSDPNRQILIFARNITISNNVKQIDAWLIADNSIDTCSEKDVGGDNPITITDCTNELVINGPVVLGTGNQDESSELKLDRMYGAESEAGDINGNIRRGEVFNYDPGAVKWAYAESLKDSKTEIQYIKERAVRY